MPTPDMPHAPLPNVDAPSSGKRVIFADGLRGFAALWVVLFHMSAGGHISHLRAALPGWLATVLFDWGHLGVPVFFVLSGFVMAMTVSRIEVDGALAARFVLRRLVRLSPPYYFALAVAVAFSYLKALALGVPKPQVGLGDIAAHMAYLELLLSTPVINTVFWTLCIEVQFYIAFACLVLVADATRMPFARLIVFGLTAAISLLWPLGLTHFALWKGDFLGFWHAFLAGVLVCWGWLEGKKMRQVATVYCFSLMGIGIATQSQFVLTVAMAACVLSAAGACGTMGKWLSWPWIQTLGLISYSLYLLHNPLTGASFRLVGKWMLPGQATEFIGVFVALVVCVLGSWLANRFIERPSMSWSRAIPLRSTGYAGASAQGIQAG